jgi:hypothetical protein
MKSFVVENDEIKSIEQFRTFNPNPQNRIDTSVEEDNSIMWQQFNLIYAFTLSLGLFLHQNQIHIK